MKTNYLTKIYGTGFSSSASTEPKLKLITKIILFVCILLLIALRSSSQCTYNAQEISASCASTCTGVVEFSASGGTPPYFLNISGGPQVAFISTYQWASACAGWQNYAINDALGNCPFAGAVFVNTIPPITAAITAIGPTTFCSTGFVVLNANTGNGFSYQWRQNNVNLQGETNPSYVATTSGNYDCIVSNVCGGVTSNNITVTVVPSTPPAIITPGGPTTFCASGSVILNANTGIGLTYQWRLNAGNIPGATLVSYTATAAGNYDCIVSNICGSSISNIIAVSVYSPFTATIAASGPTSFCYGDSVTLNASPTGSGYNYQWRKNSVNITGATLQYYVALLSGNYDVVISNGCSSVSNIISVTVFNAPLTTLTLQPNATDGTDAMIFNYGSAAQSNTNFGTYTDMVAIAWTFSGIPGTLRSLIRFDLNQIPVNSTVQQATLTLFNNPTSGNMGGSHSNLSGSNASWLQKVTSPWSESTVTWNTQPTTTTLNQVALPQSTSAHQNYALNVTTLVQDMVNDPATNYGFMLRLQTESYYRGLVFASSDCADSTKWPKLEITFLPVNSLIASITAAGPTTFCAPGSVTLNASTGVGFSYQWRLNNVPITGATTSSYAATATGNYDCIVSNICGSLSSNVIAVTANTLFGAAISAAGPTTFCYGGSVVLNATPTGSGYSYQWRSYGVDIPGATASSFTAIAQGDYDVVISNPCVAISGIITVTVTGAPSVVTLQPDATAGMDALISSYPSYVNLNFGAHPDLDAKAGTSGSVPFVTRGLIKFDLGSIPVNTTVNQASLLLFNNPASIFGPHGGSNAGWLQKITSLWDENTVTWNNQPTTTTVNQVTVPQSTSGNQDYTLDVTALVQDMVNNPSGNYGFMLRLQTEVYYRALIFASSDCADPTKWPKLIITLATTSPLTAAITAAGPNTFCSPGSVTLNANTGNGFSYQWRLNSSPIPGATISSYVAAAGGNYDCIVSNSCTSATSNVIIVTVNSSPSAFINAAGPTSFCAPGSVLLNANTGSGLSYQWRLNGVNITGATFASYSASSSGNYDCVVSNTCGSITSNILSVTTSSPPAATITTAGPTTFCTPGSATLNANTGPGLTYQWRLNVGNIPGATTSSYIAAVTGNYDCVVTNTCGSTISNLIIITAAVAPATPGNITGQATGVCLSSLTYSINPVSGATSYNWTVPSGAIINTGQGTTSLNVTFTNAFSSGSMSVVAMNSCGTSGASSIGVAAVPAQPGNITGPVSVCHNQNNVIYSITPLPGATSYTWTVPEGTHIKMGQGTPQIRVRFGNSAGNVTVTANNACGQSPVRILAIAMPCRDEITNDDFNVTLYPNPASDRLNVICDVQTGNEVLKIFNMVGEEILKSEIKNLKSEIDIASLPGGIYFIEITSGEYRKVTKFIKQE